VPAGEDEDELRRGREGLIGHFDKMRKRRAARHGVGDKEIAATVKWRLR
jgi:hypothetical protein